MSRHEFVSRPGTWRCAVCGRGEGVAVHRPPAPSACETCGWAPDTEDATAAAMLLSAHHVENHWTPEDEERHRRTVAAVLLSGGYLTRCVTCGLLYAAHRAECPFCGDLLIGPGRP